MNKMLRVAVGSGGGGGEPVWCDASTASYDSVSFDVGSQEGAPYGVAFKPDGTKMYVVGSSSDSVYQYTLSTAWDLDTASYDSVSFDVSSQEGSAKDVAFKPDGTKMYMVGSRSDSVHQYTLSTAWDLNTASYDSVSFSVDAQESSPSGLEFKPDGTKMYVVGSSSGSVHQYTLLTAWGLDTVSYDSVSFDVSSQESFPFGVAFKPDGTKMYMVGNGSTGTLYQYTLSTAWDLDTASYDSVALDVSSQESSPRGVTFKPDGTKMYLIGFSSDSVHQYSLVC